MVLRLCLLTGPVNSQLWVSEGQWAAREGHRSHRLLGAGFTPSNCVVIQKGPPVLFSSVLGSLL